MSGHSKWHSIKHQKAAVDAKKGAMFTRMGRNITLAAREAGGNPETNFKLRMAIDHARSVNMPKDNIKRAIERGTGEGSEAALREVCYEGYGPAGVAVIIKAVTDNPNRTVSDVRRALAKHGGSLGEANSVLWNFELKGVVRIAEREREREQLELAAIDAGADDIREEDDHIVIATDPKNLQRLKEELEKQNMRIEYADIEYLAKNTVALGDDEKKKLDALTDALDELEDVNDYCTNIL